MYYVQYLSAFDIFGKTYEKKLQSIFDQLQKPNAKTEIQIFNGL